MHIPLCAGLISAYAIIPKPKIGLIPTIQFRNFAKMGSIKIQGFFDFETVLKKNYDECNICLHPAVLFLSSNCHLYSKPLKLHRLFLG